MSAVTLLIVTAVVSVNVGVVAGLFLAGCSEGPDSQAIWEVTTLDGEKWFFDNPNDVDQFIEIVGLVAVRRLKATA